MIHIFDESTHFAAAALLKTQSATNIWKAIISLWIYLFRATGSPCRRSRFGVHFRRIPCKGCTRGSDSEGSPNQNPGFIGIVERYHAPLRAAYVMVRESTDNSKASDAECLQMALYYVNCTMEPEGLVPMLLLFGAIPRPVRTTRATTQLQVKTAIEQTKKAAHVEEAKRRLAFALRHPSGPKAKEVSEAIRNLPPGADVLVYHTTTKRWGGPFTYVSSDGDTEVVQLRKGRRIFRSTCVKPFVRPLEIYTTTSCTRCNGI